MNNMQMEVTLICSVCGNDQFSLVDESYGDIEEIGGEVEVRCSDCGKVTTKQELLEENRDVINCNFEDFKDEIMKEAIKDFKKLFK